MRIAWRYNALPKVDINQSVIGHSFDLTKPIDNDRLKSLNIEFFNDFQVNELNENFETSVFSRLLKALKEKLSNYGESSNSCEKNFLRICINALGSPFWYSDTYKSDVCKFLISLKALVRSSRSVCCITMPTHLLQYYVSLYTKNK